MEVHAIGDRALSAVLDAFEEAGITAADRPIVTHCQVWGRIYIYIRTPKTRLSRKHPREEVLFGKVMDGGSWRREAGPAFSRGFDRRKIFVVVPPAIRPG